MHLFELALLDMCAAAEPRRLRRRPGRAVEAGETLFHLGDHGGMIDGAGGGDHDVRRAIVPGEIVAQFARRRTNAPSSRVPRIERPSGWSGNAISCKCSNIEIVGRVGDGADLLHDHVLLAQHFVAVEGRLGEDVGKHVERQRHVGLEHARVIGGGLGTGRGVEITADGFDLLGDLPRAAPSRALERHVLEEMRYAVLVARVRRGCRN